MVTSLKSLPTLYDGVSFRSRLEARWAVFMNAAGIVWEYEPEGFDLDGIWYLPDFRIQQLEGWVEIKPTQPTDEEREKARRLAEVTEMDVYIFRGGFDSNLALSKPTAEVWLISSDGTPVWDDGYVWCECRKCGYMGIEFEGRSHRLGCHAKDCPLEDETSDRGHNSDSYRLMAAYQAARETKFV